MSLASRLTKNREINALRAIVIEWEPLNAGEIYVAHFPEPFPMSDADYAAFETLFKSWQRRHWDGVGEIRVDEKEGPLSLVRGLRFLGYRVVNRGRLPPGL